jgi:hypothetical protein
MFERRPEPSGRRFFEVTEDAIDPGDIRSWMQCGELVCSPPAAFVLDEPRALILRELIEIVHDSSVPRWRRSP